MSVPRNITFLALDDYFSIRKMVVSSLRSLGFTGEILEAEDVQAAKTILDRKKIDFIISDIEMPGESGIQFLEFIRKEEKYKNLPFLILSAVDKSPIIIEALQKGASNYLTKPWSTSDIAEKLEKVWKKHDLKGDSP